MKLLILKLKMICRECNFEIDTGSGYPEHELMNHYNSFHNRLIERCMKCMHRKYSGYHFSDKCKVNSTGHIISEHIYTDNTDLNNNINENENDFNNVLFELKYNVIEELRNYIKDELKTEIINEIKRENLNDSKIETNIKNKTNKVCCLCKFEKSRAGLI